MRLSLPLSSLRSDMGALCGPGERDGGGPLEPELRGPPTSHNISTTLKTL